MRLALLVAVTSAWGCGDGIVDPRGDVANASAVDPGPLHVRLTAPPQARDIGAMLVVEGPAIDSLQAPGLEASWQSSETAYATVDRSTRLRAKRARQLSSGSNKDSPAHQLHQ